MSSTESHCCHIYAMAVFLPWTSVRLWFIWTHSGMTKSLRGPVVIWLPLVCTAPLTGNQNLKLPRDWWRFRLKEIILLRELQMSDLAGIVLKMWEVYNHTFLNLQTHGDEWQHQGPIYQMESTCYPLDSRPWVQEITWTRVSRYNAATAGNRTLVFSAVGRHTKCGFLSFIYSR
jgi:hypothetical protein